MHLKKKLSFQTLQIIQLAQIPGLKHFLLKKFYYFYYRSSITYSVLREPVNKRIGKKNLPVFQSNYM